MKVVYDGASYPVPHAGEAYVAVYLEVAGSDGSPTDLYGETIRLRQTR